MATEMKPQRTSVARESSIGLSRQGLVPRGEVHWNLIAPELFKAAARREEGEFAEMGPFVAITTPHTGRSPNDKFVVKEPTSEKDVDWGKVNQPMSVEKYQQLLNEVRRHLNESGELFVEDLYCGADPAYRLSVRYVSPNAWHMAFARNMFIRPEPSDLPTFDPNFTVLHAPEFQADPARHGTRSGTFIVLNLAERTILIGGTRYAGELKKSMFTVMNYLLPRQGVLSMHCSANVGKGGDTALFFGLSGTGKTTLSAVPDRRLVGDDEHGWSNHGIFNFEGGCYAKCINLEKESEPQIWSAIRFGSVMENVVMDDSTREPDFDNGSLTENTRVAYPIEHINGAVIPSIAGHPKVIVFLTADAFGVMPPIAKLTKQGAMYHFMSGYTSKLAGTERGITEPKETFSHCFGAPFMPLHASKYAKMLGKKITEHGTRVYVINTGWTGGPYGIGKRMNLRYTRAMVTAAINGKIEEVTMKHHEIFNLAVPTSCFGVPNEVLDPRNTWSDKDKYDAAARRLAALFVKNFEKFGNMPKDIVKAGPRI